MSLRHEGQEKSIKAIEQRRIVGTFRDRTIYLPADIPSQDYQSRVASSLSSGSQTQDSQRMLQVINEFGGRLQSHFIQQMNLCQSLIDQKLAEIELDMKKNACSEEKLEEKVKKIKKSLKKRKKHANSAKKPNEKYEITSPPVYRISTSPYLTVRQSLW